MTTHNPVLVKQEKSQHWLEVAESLSLVGSIGSSVVAAFSQQLLPVLISVPLSLSLSQINRQRSLQNTKQAANLTLARIEQSLSCLQDSTEAIQTKLQDEQLTTQSTQAHHLALTGIERSLSELQDAADAIQLKLQGAEVAIPKDGITLSGVVPLVINPEPTPTHLGKAGKRGRVAVVIDGCNLDFSAERQKMKIDFAKLKDHLIKDSTIVNGLYYYTGTHQGNKKEQAALSELQELGYQVISKEVVRYMDGTRKGNLDVEMALDMVALAEQSDTIVLVSGDGDLAYVVGLLKQRQIRVEVFGFHDSTAKRLSKAAHPYYRNLAGLTKICCPIAL